MKLILSLAFAAGLLGATSASAAMMAPPAPHTPTGSLIQVRDGCGHGFHENRHGRCVENEDEDRDWRDHRDRHHGDGCDRWHHWSHGHCVRNW